MPLPLPAATPLHSFAALATPKALLLASAPLPSPAPGATHLRPLDLTLIVVYLAGITLFGLRFRKSGNGTAGGARSLKSYFLADNTIPWWAIALSIVSAETSTLTIISVPGVAFAGDFGFLQIVIGYMLGRIVVAALFLPRYFAGEMLTAYQLIDRRFGPALHKVTAALFLLTRAAAEGVRVFAVSIVVGIAIGTRDVLSIAIISALTLLYTFEGGMAAVIWTDVVQMFIYIAGTLVAVATLGTHVTGGWQAIAHAGAAAGKFHVLHFALNLTTTYTFWAGVLGGTFLTMASHGTDQLMVQRLLAARNLRESRAALLSSGAVIFLQFALFLLIGAGLWMFYGQHPGTVFKTNDHIFPTFIVREMPLGVAGLLVAAILAAAMSNLSAALNSLSSTTVVDFYMRLRPEADGRERNLVSKSSTVLWALVLFAIAVYSVGAGGKGHVVEIGLSIASVAYGCLLGVFLLGTLTRFATQTGAIAGMIVGFVLNLWLWQGRFPVHFGSLTIPRIAWTWYVLIGAVVTFALGALASLITRPRARGTAAAAALPAGLALILGSGVLLAAQPARAQQPTAASPQPDFTAVDALIQAGIAQHHLPGAVLVVGHSGHVVYQQVYGARKLAGEPGPAGASSPAEPMTFDTLFDMASLTKCLATATSVMQLYEQGRIDFDAPVEQYLPEFNTTHDPVRSRVTVRLLLTHFSGEPADVSLKEPWGLAAPDRAEGLHRAYTTPLQSAPAAVFRYSDINFILLGALVERVSHQREDDYVRDHVFGPLGMRDTSYHGADRACGSFLLFGANLLPSDGDPKRTGATTRTCAANTWNPQALYDRTAPTAHDDESKANPSANPDLDYLLRGTVHDPTTRRMGGVAGHAGVFSTAHDVSLYAQALLDRLAGRPSDFPVRQGTLELMVTPEQPGHNAQQLAAANDATRAASPTANQDPMLAPAYPALKDQNLRGFGWDIDTAFSKPRGRIFPIGSFGHTGFTGTSLWIDPGSDSYVVLLANAIHPRGGAPISNLRGQVATAVAQALHLYPGESSVPSSAISPLPQTLTGIDVLEATHFAQFAALRDAHHGHLAFGILTNQAGIDRNRRRTIDIFAQDLPAAIPQAHLAALFSPEHGLAALSDTTHIAPETDAATGLHVTSLYGPHDADKRPSHDQLKDLDAVVIDLQDAGVRFWTYEAVLGYFLEASAREQEEFGHRLDIVVLDRPALNGADWVQGPLSDPGQESYTNYMPMPVRHGMTYGELGTYYNANKLGKDGKPLHAPLTVVKLQGYSRREFFDETGLPWVNPSPNLRSVTAAILYPGVSLLESSNLSVGRGTSLPLEIFGAGRPAKNAQTGEQAPAWFNANDVAAALNARQIPGVRFEAITLPVAEDSNHYPGHGQTIPAVRVHLLDRNVLDSPEMGVEIAFVLHRLYPAQFQIEKVQRILANKATLDAIGRGEDPRVIRDSWQPALDQFRERRAAALLY